MDSSLPEAAASRRPEFQIIFDLERVEAISGPQALLYGVSGSGGVVNLVTKQARFNRPGAGSVRFQVDQYGNKMEQLDYGWGGARLAARVTLLNQDLGGRRLGIGGPVRGGYAQIAYRAPLNMLLRFSFERTNMDRTEREQRWHDAFGRECRGRCAQRPDPPLAAGH
jgi:catecholate siderophore receptor